MIDDRAFHHDHYRVPIPAFWAMIAAITLAVISRFRPVWIRIALAFFAAILLHLSLDSVASGGKWL